MKILFVAAGALALASCANTVNLLNPTSPRFEGAFAPPPTGHAPVTQIRVVSFNIKFAERIDAAIEVLRSGPLRDADIISLQEMDERGTERIARELRLNYVYYPGSIHPARHQYYGPAILSRSPIERSWKLILPYEAPVRRQRRNATAAVVKVVAGDFNSRGIGKYFEREGFIWPTKNVGRTITIFSWDHIFVRGLPPAVSPVAGKVRQVRGASDHRPVWATLALATLVP